MGKFGYYRVRIAKNFLKSVFVPVSNHKTMRCQFFMGTSYGQDSENPGFGKNNIL